MYAARCKFIYGQLWDRLYLCAPVRPRHAAPSRVKRVHFKTITGWDLKCLFVCEQRRLFAGWMTCLGLAHGRFSGGEGGWGGGNGCGVVLVRVCVCACVAAASDIAGFCGKFGSQCFAAFAEFMVVQNSIALPSSLPLRCLHTHTHIGVCIRSVRKQNGQDASPEAVVAAPVSI